MEISPSALHFRLVYARKLSKYSCQPSTPDVSIDVFRLSVRVLSRLFWFFAAVGLYSIKVCLFRALRRKSSRLSSALVSFLLLRMLGVQVIVDDSQPSSQEGFASIQLFDGSSFFKEIVARGSFGLNSFVFKEKDVSTDEFGRPGRFSPDKKNKIMHLVGESFAKRRQVLCLLFQRVQQICRIYILS